MFGARCLHGYRLFLSLPVWGFVAGFLLGAQTLQALFGTGFLSEVSSWVFGLIVGLLFAVLSYLFYIVAVAVLAGTFGYALGVGLMGALGIDFGLITWLVGIVLAVVVAGATILLNIQKWVIVLATAVAARLPSWNPRCLGGFATCKPWSKILARSSELSWRALRSGDRDGGFIVQY
jgi:hypothetical protein